MTFSTLPLSYCTNVHPGLSVDEVISGLKNYAGPIRRRLGTELAAGLWLADPVILELRSHPQQLEKLKAVLSELELDCYTLNAFPFGNFHSERVKEQVYLPDWSDPFRLLYTQGCAEALAELMGEHVHGSISTVPLGFKKLPQKPDFDRRSMSQLIEFALFLERLYERTGKRIRLAIEPEPLCLIETTGEALSFFQSLFAEAEKRAVLDEVRESIGLCYDVCHQAVEFEDVGQSIREIDKAGIRINKVHITCAIELNDPQKNVAGRERLAEFVEPRYLHQTFARARGGTLVNQTDLTRELCLDPPEEFLTAERWRIHFHVPVNADSLGPLETTRPALVEALKTVGELDQTPHLEVETYTWSVMPGEAPVSLIDGLSAELESTQALIG